MQLGAVLAGVILASMVLMSIVFMPAMSAAEGTIQLSNGISAMKAYTCTEESIKSYVLSEFAVDHTVDKEAIQILQSESQQLYGKEILSATVKVTSEGKEIPFYVLCSTGKVYPYEKPSFQEVTGIQKVSPDLWEKMQTAKPDETLKLIVYVKEPPGMMKESDQIINDSEMSRLDRSIKEKMEAIERGEKVNLTELDKEKAAFEAEKEKIRQKVESVHQTVLENNRRLLKPIKEQVLQKLQGFPGIRIKTSGNDITPTIGIEAKSQDIEKIREVSEVSGISIDAILTGDLDVSIPTIKANSVWSNGYIGSGIKTAVLDTGISGNTNLIVSEAHSSVPGEDASDSVGHGTNVSGVIASRHGTYRGVAYNVTLMNAKVMSGAGGQLSWLQDGIGWSLNHNAKVLSHSSSDSNTADDGNSDGSKYMDYIVDVYNVPVINSIGNNQPSPRAPGGTYNVIGVGATNDKNTVSRSDDVVASFSPPGQTVDYRKKPDVVAPGQSIYTTTNHNGFANVDGTSFSTPHVSGLAALIEQHRPAANPLIIKGVIVNSAEKRGFLLWNATWGWGYIDALNAYMTDSNTYQGTITNNQYVNKYINANIGDTIAVTLTWNRHMINATTVKGYSDLDIRVYSPSGSSVGFSTDSNDNVEQVVITAREAGNYRVEVNGYNVPAAVSPESFVLAANRYIS